MVAFIETADGLRCLQYYVEAKVLITECHSGCAPHFRINIDYTKILANPDEKMQ